MKSKEKIRGDAFFGKKIGGGCHIWESHSFYRCRNFETMKTCSIFFLAMACAVQVAAQDVPADTVQTQQLNEVVVEAQMQSA